MRVIRVVQTICCALLLLLFSLSIAAAQDSFVRITTTTPWGFVVIQTITENEAGAGATIEVRHPGSASVKRGEAAMTRGQFAAIADQLVALGVSELGDFAQPNVEDAATQRFEGKIRGRTIDFTVYGVPRDLQDTRYARIMQVVKDTTDEIPMEEVQR